MTRRARLALLLPALGLFGVILFAGFAGLPDFGHYRGPYGDVLNHVAVPERHVTNVVAAVVFDYRGFDTLGEEFILFAAVMGVVMLLRDQAQPRPVRRDEAEGHVLRLYGLLLLGPMLLVGLWLVTFGYITPGGGFQGGVILAGAVLLLYLASGHAAWDRATPETVADPVEAVGAGGYVLIGLIGLATGTFYLENLLGPGTVGTLLSAGSIGFLNWATALEVVAANVLLFREFLLTDLAQGGR